MYISIDAGGTNTRVAGILDLSNPDFVNEPLRRKNTHNFENDLQFMVDAALEIADGKPIKAVGIGTPGSPNEDKTGIKSAKNLGSWAGKPLVASLSEALGCPVFYERDVIAASLGEVYYNNTVNDFDYLIWGTGIGGAAVRHQNSQPEVTIINWPENFEAWEADCGGGALAKTQSKPSEKFTEDEWNTVIQKFQKHLSRFIEINKPPAIIFGGGLAQRHAHTLEGFDSSLGIEITITKFGADSGLFGGFGLIKQNFSA
jgi:hypothetical protein